MPVLAVPLCEVLLTFKSLFSLSSLVFCLAPISLSVTLAFVLLDPQSDLETLYSSAGSVQTVVAILSFNCMALSYLFMGEVSLRVDYLLGALSHDDHRRQRGVCGTRTKISEL
jgi:hypothetical protein